MRNFFGTLFIILLIVGGIGWYLKWFDADVKFNTNKINGDFDHLRNKIDHTFKNGFHK